MKTLYEKIEIKSVDDLPKEDGEYYAHSKTDHISIWGYDCSEEDNITWMTYTDWYFRPIEPVESEAPKSAREVLRDNLNDLSWELVTTHPVAYHADKMLADWIIDAMEEYHNQDVPVIQLKTAEAVIGDRFNHYKNWMPNKTADNLIQDIIEAMREYVKQFKK